MKCLQDLVPRQQLVTNLINFEVTIVLMGKKNGFVFVVMITFSLICTPTITFAQWPITADPSLTQNGLDEHSTGISNQTLPFK